MRWVYLFSTIQKSFRAKIFALLTFFIIVLSVIFTTSYVLNQKRYHSEKLVTEGTLLASLLAYNSRLPLFAENLPMLDSEIAGIMTHKLVLGVSICSEDGTVLVERIRPGEDATSLSPLQERDFKPLGAIAGHVERGDAVDFFAPVFSGIGNGSILLDDKPQGETTRVIGLIRVVLDKREMNGRIKGMVAASIGITFLFLVFGSSAAYVVVRGVTRPLNQLAKGVHDLEQGDLSTRISVRSHDEIGQLAEAFNNMAGALERREKENRDLAEDLRLAQQQEAKEEWERTFDTVPDLIAILDERQRIVRVNFALAERLGVGTEELIGAPFPLFHAVRTPDSIGGSGGNGSEPESEIFEERLNSYFWVTVSPLQKGNGETIGSVYVARDISERKRAEEEKKAVQAKLIQANKMTSLGLLVSGMAHEVNNPNNNIKLAAHLLTKAWDDITPILEMHYRTHGDFKIGGYSFSQVRDTIPEYIGGIISGSRRIEGIIKNLREFVRKGKANINTTTDINMVVSVSAAILNYQIKKHTNAFSMELCDSLPPVRGNPQLLEQVVINLIMNAIQSLSDPSRQVRVSTSLDSSGESVLITVYDEGCGLAPEVKTRLFEPFFSTKLDSGGTGLGLAISNVIVTEHHGTLDFSSVPGQYTSAVIRLPATAPA